MTPELSSGSGQRREYPFFFRTIPSSPFEAQAMVDIIVHFFEYRNVVLVHSSDTYGTSSALAFRDAALRVNLTVTNIRSLPTGFS